MIIEMCDDMIRISQSFGTRKFYNSVGDSTDNGAEQLAEISTDTNNITRFNLKTKYCGSPTLISSSEIPFDSK
jgi:hypothetical protein